MDLLGRVTKCSLILIGDRQNEGPLIGLKTDEHGTTSCTQSSMYIGTCPNTMKLHQQQQQYDRCRYVPDIHQSTAVFTRFLQNYSKHWGDILSVCKRNLSDLFLSDNTCFNHFLSLFHTNQLHLIYAAKNFLQNRILLVIFEIFEAGPEFHQGRGVSQVSAPYLPQQRRACELRVQFHVWDGSTTLGTGSA